MCRARDLLKTVRDVRTLDGSYPVYRGAKVSLRMFWAIQVYPISKYVLRSNLELLRNLDKQMLLEGIDIFQLRKVTYWNETVIGPPLVEYDGDVPVIVDGIHRFYLALEMGRAVNCIYVEGADAQFPVIGLPVQWEDVTLRDSLPSDPRLRRDLRPGIEDTSTCLRRHYRDLSFLGSKGRRPAGVQTS